MKIFSSEIGHNYETYTFGYTNYCLRESGDKLSEIYIKGYLPYSGSPKAKDIFYMARSARIPLATFELSSENRRITKKFDQTFQSKSIPVRDFNTSDPEFRSFCLDYFKARHGSKVMPPQRLDFILNSGLIANIVKSEREGRLVSYVFEVADEQMTHFWYSFYDLSLINQSLGLWLMIESALRAKAQGKKYLYIGTFYGEKALYKKAFKNLEYWTGSEWVQGIKTIKELAREDHTRTITLTDAWKKELELF